MRKLILSLLATSMMTATAFAEAKFMSGNSAQLLIRAKIVDIEVIYRTSRVKKYSDCREVNKTTLCDTIEYVTINKSIDYYYVTYNLGGSTFSIKEKKRPIGTEARMSVVVTPYR
jgi:hypothetical protein